MSHVLSVMTSITTCDLLNDFSCPCDLTPMQALPNLNSLYLHNGVFLNIHTLAHLTELRLFEVIVQTFAAWACCSTFKKADWHKSCVDGLHHQGLVACSNLQIVSICNSLVTAIDRHERIDMGTSSPCVPKSLSRLTNLQYFELGIEQNRPEGAELQVSQIYKLASLTHFNYVGSSDLHLELGLSQLTNLVCLSVLIARVTSYISALLQWTGRHCTHWNGSCYMHASLALMPAYSLLLSTSVCTILHLMAASQQITTQANYIPSWCIL